MARIFSLLVCGLLLSTSFTMAAGNEEYSKTVGVTRPIDNDRNRVTYAWIRVVKVHKNISIHYFKKDKDPSRYLNHAVDKDGSMYYNAILYPVIGIKTYVHNETSGEISPRELLDADSLDILQLQMQEIENAGGVENYLKLLDYRG